MLTTWGRNILGISSAKLEYIFVETSSVYSFYFFLIDSGYWLTCCVPFIITWSKCWSSRNLPTKEWALLLQTWAKSSFPNAASTFFAALLGNETSFLLFFFFFSLPGVSPRLAGWRFCLKSDVHVFQISHASLNFAMKILGGYCEIFQVVPGTRDQTLFGRGKNR